MPFFPPRAPSWSPKPRKKQSFLTLPPKGPKHCKKRCFLTPQAKDTVNYRSFSRPGVVWGCVGGGSAAGGAVPITFGYHRRPPTRTRAGLVYASRPCRRPTPEFSFFTLFFFLFFFLHFSSLTLPISAFHLSTLSKV